MKYYTVCSGSKVWAFDLLTTCTSSAIIYIYIYKQYKISVLHKTFNCKGSAVNAAWFFSSRSETWFSALWLTPCVPDMWHDATGPSLSRLFGWRQQRSGAGTRRRSRNPAVLKKKKKKAKKAACWMLNVQNVECFTIDIFHKFKVGAEQNIKVYKWILEIPTFKKIERHWQVCPQVLK